MTDTGVRDCDWPTSQDQKRPPYPGGLLRARRDRPRRRAAEERDELAALHSITSSARAMSVGGTSRPSLWRL
jgi:hypothetical protein